MNFQGIIFDCDGVILDSVPLHIEAWTKLFSGEFGLEFNKAIYEEKVDGRPRLDAVREMLPDLNEVEVHEAGELKQQFYMDMVAQGKVVEFTCTIQFIKKIKSAYPEVKLAVASSSKNVVHLLERCKLDHLFETVVSGHDFTHGKPHPEIFLLAAERIGLQSQDCCVVEDAIAGIQSAKAGGFYCVGLDRYGQPEQYAKADQVTHDLNEIKLSSLF